jgi:hypothetical protein
VEYEWPAVPSGDRGYRNRWSDRRHCLARDRRSGQSKYNKNQAFKAGSINLTGFGGTAQAGDFPPSASKVYLVAKVWQSVSRFFADLPECRGTQRRAISALSGAARKPTGRVQAPSGPTRLRETRFTISLERRTSPCRCFVAFPDGEQVSTSPGNALMFQPLNSILSRK